MLWNRVRVVTKRQAAYEEIRGRILSGSCRPGDRLVIDRLASQLGMSAIPVREALGLLEQEGWVENRPHAGAVVSGMTRRSIEEVFAVMEALECAACRLAAGRLDATALDEMESIVVGMEATKRTGEWLRLNRKFHESVPRLAGLDRILDHLIRAGQDWERLRALYFAEVAGEDLRAADAEHREFLVLLARGSVVKQEEWVRRHNRAALERYWVGVDEEKKHSHPKNQAK
ncbi:MAG: GntR family transcriptional regulator [Candidatus Methylacidiphilales bacterium]